MAKTLIKWPGGKSSEIRQFITMIPDYDRYIEPFAGGAALYFELRPERAVLNDSSENLMKFYELVKKQDPEFHRDLNAYDRSFSALKHICDEQFPQILALYKLYAFADREGMDLSFLQPHRHLVNRILSGEGVLGELVIDREEFETTVADAVNDKFLRTARLERKKPLSDRDRKANLVTGFMEGFYFYFRQVFNDIAAGRVTASGAYAIANFYFIREYCYGSMFRYNKKGEFNIPYGGISYNRKDLTGKIQQMFSDRTASLLQRTQLFCMDFEELLDRLNLTQRDFLFLDPPYDTEFSDYEGNKFDRDDQRRLADFLDRTQAQFLLVIKNTDFIYSLYEPLGFRMLAFENRYLYNVRSRNERKSEHLIITNIPEGEIPWIRENAE